MSRRIAALLGAVAMATLLGRAPGAAAAELLWQGTLTFTPLAPAMPALVVRGSGVSTVNAFGGGSHLTSLRVAGGFTGSALEPVTDPEVTASGIVGVRLAVSLGTGGVGFLSGAGQGLAPPGTLPMHGLLGLCVFDPSCLPGGFIELPLTRKQGASGLGVGGVLTAGGFGALRISLVAAPWTVGTTSLVVTTPSGSTALLPVAGWRHGALSFSTSTALPGGELSLVTPLRTTSGSATDLTSVARLTLRLVPEPGSGLLLSSGAAALWIAGRRRARSRGSRHDTIDPHRPAA